MRHLLFFFLTITTLDNQGGYLISLMNMDLRTFPTSFPIACCFSPSIFHFLCVIVLKVRSTISWWHMISRSMPSMSEGFHANRSRFFLRIHTIPNSSSGARSDPIYVARNAFGLFCIILTSLIGVRLSCAGSSLGLRSIMYTFTRLTSLEWPGVFFFKFQAIFITFASQALVASYYSNFLVAKGVFHG